MPIDFVAFTADRRISGRIMLADDRLSDMLNAVPRIVVRDAQVDELTENAPASSRRRDDRDRRALRGRRVRAARQRDAAPEVAEAPGIGRPRPVRRRGRPRLPERGRPARVERPVGRAGEPRPPRPVTDATITYDRADGPSTESFETVLVNRARATWIDLEPAAILDPYGAEDEEENEASARTRYMKDFTNSIAE